MNCSCYSSLVMLLLLLAFTLHSCIFLWKILPRSCIKNLQDNAKILARILIRSWQFLAASCIYFAWSYIFLRKILPRSCIKNLQDHAKILVRILPRLSTWGGLQAVNPLKEYLSCPGHCSRTFMINKMCEVRQWTCKCCQINCIVHFHYFFPCIHLSIYLLCLLWEKNYF